MSRNARTVEDSYSLKEGMSPLTILQKIQFAAVTILLAIGIISKVI